MTASVWGFIGFALEKWLESVLNPVGTGLLLSGTAVLSLMLATTFSPPLVAAVVAGTPVWPGQARPGDE